MVSLCTLGYTGNDCGVPICFGNSTLLPNAVTCSNHGVCKDYNQCECSKHYTGSNCEIEITCNKISSQNTTSVCNGKGVCLEMDTCICMEGYGGLNCQDLRCFEQYGNAGCNHQGICSNIDTCTCSPPYIGINCRINGLFLLFIPILCIICFGTLFLCFCFSIVFIMIKKILTLVKKIIEN